MQSSGLLSRMGKLYTVIHFAPVTRVMGRAVQGAESSREDIMASVQTASPYEMSLLPEGQNSRQGLRIYTDFQLKAASEQTNTKGDRLLAYGRQYEVQRIDPYPIETRLPHFRALALLVEDDNTPEAP